MQYITCRELIEFLDEYISNAMSPTRRQKVEEHLGVCPDCVNYLESYKSTIEISMGALRPTEEPAPGDVPNGLLDAILATKRSSAG